MNSTTQYAMKNFLVTFDIFGKKSDMLLMATDEEMAKDLVISHYSSKLGIDSEFIEFVSIERKICL